MNDLKYGLIIRESIIIGLFDVYDTNDQKVMLGQVQFDNKRGIEVTPSLLDGLAIQEIVHIISESLLIWLKQKMTLTAPTPAA